MPRRTGVEGKPQPATREEEKKKGGVLIPFPDRKRIVPKASGDGDGGSAGGPGSGGHEAPPSGGPPAGGEGGDGGGDDETKKAARKLARERATKKAAIPVALANFTQARIGEKPAPPDRLAAMALNIVTLINEVYGDVVPDEVAENLQNAGVFDVLEAEEGQVDEVQTPAAVGTPAEAQPASAAAGSQEASSQDSTADQSTKKEQQKGVDIPGEVAGLMDYFGMRSLASVPELSDDYRFRPAKLAEILANIERDLRRVIHFLNTRSADLLPNCPRARRQLQTTQSQMLPVISILLWPMMEHSPG